MPSAIAHTRLIVGLEIHVELCTRSKMFTRAPNPAHVDFDGSDPNSLVDPLVAALPGTLPVMNRAAVEMSARVGMALGCEIAKQCRWDRKNYFYPDLPKGYQISQYDQPLCGEGKFELPMEDGSTKTIGIIRAHLEEDTGKLGHELPGGRHYDGSLVDLNRAGTPLLEIVTAPDFASAAEVVAFAQNLRVLCRFLGVTEGVMQKGHMRFEPNINVEITFEDGTTVRTPIVEVKNLNSFKAVWVQLFEDAKPIGAPIVLEPLRSAPSVRTMRGLRKDSNEPYTRVVGWGDRLLNPADQEVVAASAQWIASEPIVLSGFRTEMDVDAIVVTDAGPIRIALAPDAAPATVRNFVTLADQGFYNNTVFHRIVPMNREGQPFVVQGGDPTGTGDGGPGWNLVLEPSDLPHDLGVVGMARGDEPHSAGSQFYFALSREGTAKLDNQYCTFGFVVSGRDALQKIVQANIADATTGRPTSAPKIQYVEIVPAPARARGENRRDQRVRPELINPFITPASPQMR